MGQPIRARAAVFRRDMGICRDCGRDCTSYETPLLNVLGDPIWPEQNYCVQINRERALHYCDHVLKQRSDRGMWPMDLGNWHVDHAMPLHLVDRSQPDAWQYWTLENLRTRCPECHKAKTAQEAKDRGKVRRIKAKAAAECPECHKYAGKCPACHRRRPKPKRKIPQRANPWPKGKRQWPKGRKVGA